ncbi:hypothetical protein ACIQAC_23910 [Streptomyces sp. NPDC088387]|uniref:hypothetical protein n=1 Tax=Streptomyces sp. NPDC088387 TaxID=3365859 RepID=UPI0037F7032F
MPRQPGPPGGTGYAEHSHDPHEVTVQLDAVQLGAAAAVRAVPRGGHEGSDGPVFVDETGRRSRRFRRIGIAVAVACAVYAVVIVGTLMSGNSNAPWLPVPGQQEGQPAGQVDTSPVPERSAEPTDPGATAPGSTPTATDGPLPSSGAGLATPDDVATSAAPGTSADPGPTKTGDATKPGTGPTDADPDPSVPVTNSPDPDPDPTETVTTSPDPTTSEGGAASGGTGTGTGSDTTANGPSINRSSVNAASGTGTGTSAVALPASAAAAGTAAPAARPSALSPYPEYVL